MTFRTFVDSTTADASDSNDQFYHIGQGSVLPMQGSSLANTNGTLDLGSSSYAWNNAYINSIPSTNLNSNNQTWEFISRTAVSVDTTRINITGLDTSDIEFLMVYLLKTSTSTAVTVTMYMNQYSAGSYTTTAWYQTSVTAATGAKGVAVLSENIGTTSTSLWTWGFLEFRYQPKSGGFNTFPRGYNLALTGGESYIDYNILNRIGFDNTNTSGTLTSIQIISETGNILAGSFIDLYSYAITEAD